jgi:hypothetical protein
MDARMTEIGSPKQRHLIVDFVERGLVAREVAGIAGRGSGSVDGPIGAE